MNFSILFVLIILLIIIFALFFLKRRKSKTFITKDIIKIEEELGLNIDEEEEVLDLTGLKKEFKIVKDIIKSIASSNDKKIFSLTPFEAAIFFKTFPGEILKSTDGMYYVIEKKDLIIYKTMMEGDTFFDEEFFEDLKEELKQYLTVTGDIKLDGGYLFYLIRNNLLPDFTKKDFINISTGKNSDEQINVKVVDVIENEIITDKKIEDKKSENNTLETKELNNFKEEKYLITETKNAYYVVDTEEAVQYKIEKEKKEDAKENKNPLIDAINESRYIQEQMLFSLQELLEKLSLQLEELKIENKDKLIRQITDTKDKPVDIAIEETKKVINAMKTAGYDYEQYEKNIQKIEKEIEKSQNKKNKDEKTQRIKKASEEKKSLDLFEGLDIIENEKKESSFEAQEEFDALDDILNSNDVTEKKETEKKQFEETKKEKVAKEAQDGLEFLDSVLEADEKEEKKTVKSLNENKQPEIEYVKSKEIDYGLIEIKKILNNEEEMLKKIKTHTQEIVEIINNLKGVCFKNGSYIQADVIIVTVIEKFFSLEKSKAIEIVFEKLNISDNAYYFFLKKFNKILFKSGIVKKGLFYLKCNEKSDIFYGLNVECYDENHCFDVTEEALEEIVKNKKKELKRKIKENFEKQNLA